MGLVLWPVMGAAEAVVTLHYYERPPYLVVTADGGVGGLTATPAVAAFRKAGVPFVWQKTPIKRQLLLIQRGDGLHCAAGPLKNAERERLGKFSKPLYRDRGFVVLARAGLHLPRRVKLADLLANPTLRLLLKDGNTYGSSIGPMLANARGPTQVIAVESLQMLRMVSADRADWMLATEEEARYLLSIAGAAADALETIALTDVPTGEFRYLYCSKAVPDAVMERLNAAIGDLPPSAGR